MIHICVLKKLLVICILSTSESTLNKGGRFIISHLDPMRLLKSMINRGYRLEAGIICVGECCVYLVNECC